MRQQAQIQQQSGDVEAAIRSYRTILADHPGDPVSHFCLGNLYHQTGQRDTAAGCYRDALRLEPEFVTAHNNLGTLQKELGQIDEAIASYRQALLIRPDYAIAHNNLGMALKESQQLEAAASSFGKAVELEPEYFKAHYNLGKTWHELSRHDDALASYRRAIAIRPDFAEAIQGLANALQDIGQIRESVAGYRRVLELDPDNQDVQGSLLFVLNYLADLPPAAMIAEARRYGSLVLGKARPYREWDTPANPDRRLRVGFVSGDLLDHPVGYFLESALDKLCRQDIELHAYSNNAREDALTLRIRPYFKSWCQAHALDDAGLAQRIHDDRIDILVDLSGHTAHSRLPVFAWKPAPVQASWLGYFATTGVPGVDHFIGDHHVCPPGEEDHFTESVWRLPDAYYCFTPPFMNIEPGALPAARNGFVTFGCFNKLAKMNDGVVETWSRILAGLPGSILFLKSGELSDPERQKAVRERFAAHGIAPGRLRFEGRTPREQYMQAYGSVDIALDPFPFPGGTTTAQGLWMGVPALTLRGDRFIGHQGETILRNIGLPEWIAADRDDYVAKAIRFATDIEALAALRGRLRAQLLGSPLCDAPRFAANFEQALRGMWRQWCAGRVPDDSPAETAAAAGAETRHEDAIDSLLARAMARLSAGHEADALAQMKAILDDHPDHGATLGCLGMSLGRLGRLDEALPYLDRATGIDPDNAELHLYLGLAQRQLGDTAAAAASYRRAAELEPDDYLVHNYLGNALRDLDRPQEAAASYRRAAALNPDIFQTHNNLADVLHRLGHHEEAAASLRRAIELKPDYAIAHNNLGNTLKALDRGNEAMACFRQAVALDPGYHEAHNNLGVALHEAGAYHAALASYAEALRSKPGFIEALNNRAGTLQDLGHLDDSIAGYREALAHDPGNAESHSNLLFSQNYVAGDTPEAMLAEARRYGGMVTARARPFKSWHNVPDPHRRLRVGLVSGDLRRHPVGYFLETTLAALDPARVELHAYATERREDELTARIKPYFAGWRHLKGIADDEAARLIHGDAIDILIDLAGHTAYNRLPVFAWKPAPVQAAWLGYFATTGVPGMDYLIADPHVVPVGEESHFTEVVHRLPEVYYCFTPPDAPVPVTPPPALSTGGVTFGCFNRHAKMNDRVIEVWSGILEAVPGSRLILKSKGLSEAALGEDILARYARHGIEPERIVLEDASPRTDYLAAYGRVDIALDPFPFPGGTTTAEALWMGVPVLTLRGDRFIGHQGETILHNAGLADWIAQDRDDYVRKAVAFADDLPALAGLRQRLRGQLLASPLCDAGRFAGHFEAALRTLWKTWCAGLHP